MTARIFHTSDWHLGAKMRTEHRAVDHDAVIDEMCEIAQRFRPDLVVHTGDLFDTTRPAHDELRRALRATRRLAELAPVVVLAGNHDAPSCFELLAEAVGAPAPADGWDPYAPCDVPIRFLPRPAPAQRGAVATYAAADGTPIRLACLPFVHPNRVLTGFEAIADLNATYTDNVRRVMTALSDAVFAPGDAAGIVAVWASHLHVDGARLSSERAIYVSAAYATDPAHLDAGYSYLAFGHIHRPQEIPGGRGRYAGSPIEIDFGEEGERKTVVCVTAEPATRAVIEPVELTSGRRIRRIRCSLDELAAFSPQIGRDICAVTVDDAPADVESLDAAVRDALPDACVIQVIDGRRATAVALDELDLAAEAAADEPIGATYRRWLAEAGNVGPQGADLARVCELFDELHAAVAGEEDAIPAEQAALERLAAEETLV